MAPEERASIESQVILKAAVELAVAEIGNDPDGVAVTMAIENAEALAIALPKVQKTLLHIRAATPQQVVEVVKSQEEVVEQIVQSAFPGATAVPATTASGRPSMYIDDSDYAQVYKIFLTEKTAGIAYASKDSMFMDNQAVRKLFQTGAREFPADYWAESMRGKAIPVTKTGKCGLGDFKIKKAASVGDDGTPFLGAGDGNHPLANKSGYFGGLQKHSPFNWGERPNPIDPHGWLAHIDA
tara:strand:- start:42 stop:761 length:720 start_codon:yes stop_codon:yes gene_type:complete